MSRRTAALHTLVGAYVMDAVPESDRAAFERHLGGCPACQEEVRGLREATARLATASAITPRPELREQTLLAATRLRQFPPLVAEPGDAQPGLAGLGRRLTARRGRPAAAGGIFRSGWLRMASVAGVAVAVICAGAAIGLGLHLSTMQHRLSAAEQRDHAIAAVLGAKDAVRMTAPVRTGGTATVVMSHRSGSLVFVASKLSSLPASRAYEVWFMGPSGNRPMGILPPEHDGMSGPMVMSGMRAGDEVALTIEPATGARQPTSAPIVLIGL